MSETESECCRADPLGREPCDAIIDADKEIDSLRAEVNLLTKERDFAFNQFEPAIARAQLAEKSRNEAVADMNKALEKLRQLRADRNGLETALGKASNLATSANQRLFDKEKEISSLAETLGQLRSDLHKAERDRDDSRAQFDLHDELLHQVIDDREHYKARAQSAEASLSKLREVATKAEIALENVYTLVWGECPSLLNEDSGGSAHLDHDCRTALAALRSLLDEPDKDQNNAKR